MVQAQTAAPVVDGRLARLTAWWNSPPSTEDFDIESAIFVVMGGFTIASRGYPNKRLTVTPKGLILLLHNQLILPRTFNDCKKDIIDKAKADMMSKFLVCTQALWLICAKPATHVI